LSGGTGNDILVSGTGRSLAAGGDGDDIFVLSALSRTDRLVEFVIADASTTDRLYVPYNFLKPDSAGFEGSELFPVLGGVTSIAGQTGFADLPQHAGPGPHGLLDLEGVAYLLFRTQQEQIFTPDATTGIVDIAGQIYFNRDGDDLLIHVFEGFAFEGTYFNSFGEPYQYTDVLYFADSEAVIRVVDFQDGMLGIDFYDLGNSTPFDFTNYAGPGSTELYENWDTIAQTLTNNGVLTSALPAEPDTPAFDLPADGQPDAREQLEGTEGDDLIIASAPVGAVQATAEDAAFSSGSDLSGGAGNDTLVGSNGRDRLDGGTGSDTMSGGGGNDLYLVDSAGDVVNESANGGLDTVAASLSYVLTANVENLNLTGAAVEGQGNTLANKINGTTAANVLAGFGGDDTLYGAAGDDLLDGGEGNDVIVYMIGDGSDTIADTGTEGDLDVLKLVGFETLDVGLFISAANSDDALLRFADGERATLLSFFTGQSIDSIHFDDGTIWDRSFITSQAIASGALLNDAPIAGSDEGFFTHLGDIVIPKADLLANDRDSDGDSLEIVAAASETPGATAVVTSEGDLRLTVAPGQTGAVLFTYTLSDGRGGLSTGRGDITFIANAAPILSTAPPADQSIEAGEMWAFSLPIETFADPDGHSMVYTADLSDGSPLPGWLTYDADTRTFEGTPPPDFAGELEIRITASDSVASTSATFRLTITDGGGGGTPTIIGTSGRDRLTGTDGHDIFDAMGGNDRMDGRDGDDIFLAAGEAGFDTYIGGAGLDAIQGSAGDDVIGIAGQTGLLSGIESIDGGAGFNILRLTNGSNILDLSDVTVANINLIDAGGGHDTVIGSAGDDVIMAGGGRDRLFGNGGNDTFQFAIHSGRDTYNGGSGFDTILGSSGDDILRLDNGSADLVSIEAIALGDGLDSIRLSPGDDVLDLSGIAVSGVDRIQAGAGNDRIVASFADDTLYGGAGQDTFVFREGFGNDTIADFRISRGGTRPSDSIDLSDLGFGTIIDVFINAQQIGADTVITDPDSGSTLTLSRIQLAQLSAADFIL
jgi:Ca2+-binding RTX toxin-like protein